MGGGRGRGGAAAAAAASTNTSAAAAAATQSAAATPSLAPDDSSDSSDNDLPEISGDILNYNSQSSGNTDTTLSYTAASTAGGYGFMTPGMFGMGFGGGFHPRSPGLFGGGGFGGGGESHPDMAGRPGGGKSSITSDTFIRASAPIARRPLSKLRSTILRSTSSKGPC